MQAERETIHAEIERKEVNEEPNTVILCTARLNEWEGWYMALRFLMRHLPQWNVLRALFRLYYVSVWCYTIFVFQRILFEFYSIVIVFWALDRENNLNATFVGIFHLMSFVLQLSPFLSESIHIGEMIGFFVSFFLQQNILLCDNCNFLFYLHLDPISVLFRNTKKYMLTLTLYSVRSYRFLATDIAFQTFKYRRAVERSVWFLHGCVT